MKTKGQAAMEFLMTYGWAILAAIIVIGVLAVYFRPSSLTSNSFAVTAPFYGVGAVMAGSGVDLEIRNNGGESVDVSLVTVNYTSPTGSCGVDFNPARTQVAGNSSVYSLTSCGTSSGDSASGTVTVYYTRQGSSLTLTSTGTISGTVA